jgi:hypothetical protein
MEASSCGRSIAFPEYEIAPGEIEFLLRATDLV